MAAIAEVLASYQERMVDLEKDHRFQILYVFKNSGPRAGASLAHAHSQLVALPMIPPFIEGKLARARARITRTSTRSLFSDILHSERADGQRLVAENDGFLSLLPVRQPLPLRAGDFSEAPASPLRFVHRRAAA